MPRPNPNRVHLHYDRARIVPRALLVCPPVQVAALTCRSWYWGADDKSRMAGPTAGFEYRPGVIGHVLSKFEPKIRRVCVIFTIQGDPEGLDLRRRLFANAQIYVDPDQFRKRYPEILRIIEEHRLKAQERMDQLIDQKVVL